MIGLDFKVIGADVISKEMGLLAHTAPAKIARKVTYWGHVLEARVKARASGRPGPNVITGDYRRSWTTEVTLDAHGASAIVGTNKPQGPRLEYGFAGTDSLGRHYNQSPYPHLNPAADEIEDAFHRDMATVLP